VRGLKPLALISLRFVTRFKLFHMPLIFFLCSLFHHIPRLFPGLLLLFACLVVGRIFLILGESRRVLYRQIGDRTLIRLAL
jgi:hypothetical protein